MKERLQGIFIGAVSCAIVAGGIAYARTETRNIDVTYDNIKVYKDNVLCELKDGNGSTIEPFIYDGTTYLPVRGTANLADMQVTWDGSTKSVYLWDALVPDGTSFIDVCPPYDMDHCDTYSANNGQSFTMAGTKYSDGIAFSGFWGGGYALFNLDSRYSTIECTVGHTESEYTDNYVSFIVDGKVVQTVELEAECLPKKVSIPVNYGLQLKIQASDDGWAIGVGNMTVR